MPLQLGKKPARPDAVKLKLAAYIDPKALPKPPAEFGHERLVTNWGMLGNDKAGCCFAEGTLVSPGSVVAAMRIPYDGPVISLRFASGKRLTVTPNHAVLTPTGFTIADRLQEGDDCIGGGGAEIMQSLFGGNDSDHSPAPVEKVFASLLRSAGGTSRRIPMVPSVNLDGDERFFDGDIEVVTADGLLERESDAPFGEPYGKEQVGATGQLQATLHRLGAPLKALLASRPSAHGGVGGSSHSLALIDREPIVMQGETGPLLADLISSFDEQPSKYWLADPGIGGDGGVAFSRAVTLEKDCQIAQFAFAANSQLLTDSTHLYASVRKPTADGLRTDPHLAGDLFERFPGLVATDRIVNIEREWLHGFVYDLSTENRWLVSDGIITHNCVWSGAGHEVMLWNREAGKTANITTTSTLRNYSLATGYDPVTGANDDGTDMEEAAKYRRTTGLLDADGKRHKIGAYVALEPGNLDQLWYATYLFDGLGIGVEFPAQWMDAFNKGQPWGKVRRPKKAGGHYITGPAYRGGGEIVISWGLPVHMTPAGYQQFNDETLAYLTEEKLTHGKSLDGFDLATLRRDLQLVTRQ